MPRAGTGRLALRFIARVACALSFACAAPERGEAPEGSRWTFDHPAMGTTFRLVLYAPDEHSANVAAGAAKARIDAIERVATDYDSTSEARRLGRDAAQRWVPVSSELARVLRASDRAVNTSGGAFDPTLGSLVRLWRRALRDREWPDAVRWEGALARTGWARLVALDEREDGLYLRLASEGVRFDFGAIAKGVAVDEALAALQRAGVRRALVDGGGDVAALDPPPGSSGWRVTVAPFDRAGGPRLRFLVANAAIATSGDAFQRGSLRGAPLPGVDPGRVEGGGEYGHVLDPRTGRPLAAPRAAVMTAATAAEADAFATARLVLGAERAGVDALERGIFFGPSATDACVGAHFPHDGVEPGPDDEDESWAAAQAQADDRP